MKRLLPALFLMINALPAVAQEAPSTTPVSAPAPVPAAAPAKPKKLCRREEVTGSYVGRVVCHTKEEWADIDQENARNSDDALDHLRSSGRVIGAHSGN